MRPMQKRWIVELFFYFKHQALLLNTRNKNNWGRSIMEADQK